jgi:hypothetical protein
MTRTLLLAERPFRDLRSRAVLLGLAAPFGAAGPVLVATAAQRCPPGFAPVAPDADPVALGIARVVIAGAFQDRAALTAALAAAARAVAAGATLEVLHLSLDGEAARPAPPQGAELLDAAARIALRDCNTADTLITWRVAAALRIAPYPEALPPGDPSLLVTLPDRPLIGVAIHGGEATANAWRARLAALRRLLAPAQGWPVLPLPVEVPGSPMDDLPGSLAFAAALLPGSPTLLPELADAIWRRRQLTPARLKALVGRCRVVVSTQDLPAALAVASGVPVLGLALAPDRRIASCLATLANSLPSGSQLLYPPKDG